MAFFKKDIEQTMKLMGIDPRYEALSLESIA